MCIIAASARGVNLPSAEYRKNMFDHNDDGAGFAWLYEGIVHYRKGFMTFAEMEEALEEVDRKFNLKDCDVVLHYRIGTAGGNVPGNTHPFPIVNDFGLMKKLNYKGRDAVVFHNGIIHNVRNVREVSDTMVWIHDRLFYLEAYSRGCYRNAVIRDLISKDISNGYNSKLAILDTKGITKIGDFIEGEDGNYYSNSTYSYPAFNYALYSKYGAPYPYDAYDSDFAEPDTANEDDYEIVVKPMQIVPFSEGYCAVSFTRDELYEIDGGNNGIWAFDEEGNVYQMDALGYYELENNYFIVDKNCKEVGVLDIKARDDADEYYWEKEQVIVPKEKKKPNKGTYTTRYVHVVPAGCTFKGYYGGHPVEFVIEKEDELEKALIVDSSDFVRVFDQDGKYRKLTGAVYNAQGNRITFKDMSYAQNAMPISSGLLPDEFFGGKL